ncbi:unnamed protein product [Phyllotreta striolata]|uniref:Uncharacterized protein n=1 Tax=Phyllotreta striolata TaxID=444603 RepID=A0A9N9XNT0_PHYSR|nr:unnamed protein product [Phyllotreta striolata]
MFAKIFICIILSVVLIESVSSSAAPRSQPTSDSLLVRQLQLREGEVAPPAENSINNFIRNLLNIILKAILNILVSLGCTVIQPYLNLISIFRSTVIEGLSLIVKFVGQVINQFAPSSVDVVNQLNQGLITASDFLKNVLAQISGMGCTAAV